MNNGWKPDYQRRELPKNIFALGLGFFVLGLILAVIAFIVDFRRASFNTIIIFTFITSVGVGSLFFVALEYLAGAVWSVPIRRTAEFLAALVFIAPILAVPALINMPEIFHWIHADAADKILASKSPYLNMNFFLIRFAAVFLVWWFFYALMIRNSGKQDFTGNQGLTKTNIRLSAVFMPVLAVTLTVTAIDWLMSLEPHWYSTIFGVYYFAGVVLAALAAITFASVTLNEKGLLIGGIRRDHYYSLGALLFAFTNFWGYIAFSQYLLIWYANLPEETVWFLNRWHGSWKYISIGLIFVRFIVPYAALLSQPSKMNPRNLKFAAVWILFAHYYDLYWLVMPAYNEHGAVVGWMEFVFPVLAAGIIIVAFNLVARRRNIVPIGDPKLKRALEFRL